VVEDASRFARELIVQNAGIIADVRRAVAVAGQAVTRVTVKVHSMDWKPPLKLESAHKTEAQRS